TILIRSWLGTGRVDEASAAMTTLTEIAGGANPASLAKLHLDLSQEMIRSYAELTASGGNAAELLNIITKSFEQLSRNASSLSSGILLRAATSAKTLAESVTPAEEARGIFGQAAVLYEALLQTGLPDPASETAVRFRLADVVSRSGRFEDSLVLYDKLLADQPRVFSAQIKAAQALQALGTESQNPELLAHAISGSPQKPHLWGWGKISTTMQRLLAKDPSRDDYRDSFLEARLHIAECRIACARSYADSGKKQAELEKALRELATLTFTTKSFDADGWKPLNEIYQTIQKLLSRTPQPLYKSAK
ncbi:MAG: hypothetical protein VB858_12960, partial [Planctomycetaceae bacterium]